MKFQFKNDDRLLRRVQFLDPGSRGLSVDIERLTTYPKAILDKARFRLFSIVVDDVKNIGFDTLYDPIPDNPAHSLITGKFTDSGCKMLARSAVRVNYPERENN